MHWSLHQLLMVVLLSGLILRIDKLFAERKWKNIWKWGIFIVILFFSGYSDQRGWPSRTADVEDFVFISGVVQKPTANYAGKIYIWVRLKSKPDIPFAIELDYDEDLAKKVNLANLKSIIDGEMSIDMSQFKEIKQQPPKREYIEI